MSTSDDKKVAKVVKTVLVQAVPAPGFNGHGEAHRYWPAGTPVKVEILDQEDDGPLVPTKRKRGEHVVVEMDHDMTRIGQRSWRALVANPRIRILSDGELVGQADHAAIRAELDTIRAEHAMVKTDNAQLEADNTVLRAQLDEALKRLGEKPGNITPPKQSNEKPPVTPGTLVSGEKPEVGEDDGGEDEDAGDTQVDPAARQGRRPPPQRNRDAAKAADAKKNESK